MHYETMHYAYQILDTILYALKRLKLKHVIYIIYYNIYIYIYIYTYINIVYMIIYNRTQGNNFSAVEKEKDSLIASLRQ